MIAVLKNTATKEQISNLVSWFESIGLKVNESKGEYCTVLGLIGDTSAIDINLLQGLDIIESVTRVSETFKKANRKFHPEDTVVDVGGVKIGGGNFAVIAGPCSVESEEQIMSCARAVKAAGATILRGGAFKPRTSPYDFQGLHEEGIRLLLEAKKETGLPICSEIMSPEQIPVFEDVDFLQVGARNMQNFDLLKALGKTGKPVLLKRGLSATIKELLMSAEYIMSEGNPNVILCERESEHTRHTREILLMLVLSPFLSRSRTFLSLVILLTQQASQISLSRCQWQRSFQARMHSRSKFIHVPRRHFRMRHSSSLRLSSLRL